MKKIVIFDLDGTLTDSGEGITRCVQYALEAFDIQETDPVRLNRFIGPPLDVSFRQFYGMNEKDAWHAVEKYRERYKTTGIYENKVYPGIPECLKTLQMAGKENVLGTSKPEIFARQILDYFHLTSYFQVITGCELNGNRKGKADVLRENLHRLQEQNGGVAVRPDEIIMVGDRREDVLGARECGLQTVGVRYGFAEEGELEEAGADYFAETPAQLQKLLLQL